MRAVKCNISDQLRSAVGTFLWSTQFVKADQYWNEFKRGVNGRPPLQMMEDEYGNKWRNDILLGETNSGKKSTILKHEWSQRTPIYNYIIFRTELQNPETLRCPEHQAVKEVQDIFDECTREPKDRNKPSMSKVVSRLRNKIQDWDGLNGHPYPKQVGNRAVEGKAENGMMDGEQVSFFFRNLSVFVLLL